ncbi:TPM domain-containing protein [Vagococcus fluvialis]|uniref:TPM domain-containing protein n=1 Tax=Vagococcus fluvialis TaxID=2738 RepID=UPI0024AF0747|nr:TPM domain-containing protein [Vagococcus fluvialis]
MKKRHLLTYLLVLLGLSFLLPSSLVSAEENTSKRVYDEANLFTPKEINSFEKEINQIRETYKTDVVIYTTLSTDGKAPKDFAADFYDYNGFGIGETKDGLIFLIDMGSRKYQTVTTGNTIAVINDSRIDKMNGHLEDSLRDQRYGDTIETLFSDVTSYLKQGPAKGYRYNPETGQSEKVRYISATKIIIALVVASISGGLFYFRVTSTYKLKKSTYHYPYRNQSEVNLTDSQSVKTADFVTTRHIPKPPSNSGGGGGGSSTFTGSSGTSHGGGGGSF